MEFREKQLINYRGHECIVLDTWYDEDECEEGITITPAKGYGFPIGVPY